MLTPGSGAIRKGARGCDDAWPSMTARNVSGETSMRPTMLRDAESPPSSAMLRAIAAEQLVLGRFVDALRRERADDARDVEEMTIAEVVRNTVAAPGAAAHGQRERQRVVVTAAGREAMRLVDDHASHRQRQAERHRAVVHPRMQSDRMPGALVAQQCGCTCTRLREV